MRYVFSARLRALGLLCAVGVLLLVPATAGAVSFSYTGGSQSWTVPAGVNKIVVEARGADGASVSSDFDPDCLDSQGGEGDEYRGVIPVVPGESLGIVVGGAGSGMSGGFNGGGAGASAPGGGPANCAGAGGGGASDVRRGSTKVFVAGGGAGACSTTLGGLSNGGRGSATAGGAGGVGSSGGSAGAAGSLGQGGAGGTGTSTGTLNSYGGGGGGGGYYGGGGGGGGGGCGYGGRGGSFVTSDGAAREVGGRGITSDQVDFWVNGVLLAQYPRPSRSGAVTITPVEAPNVNPGSCPEGQTGTPPACVDPELIDTPNPTPSDDCAAGTAVLDGYFGSLYTRLRTLQAGSETWVCARLQPEGGTEYAGGKFVAGNATTPVSVDDKWDLCDNQPGYSHLTGGELGDPSDPTYTPYTLDTWTSGSQAWLCLRAGLGARVMVNSGANAPFQQDDPTLATSPPRTPWTPGVPSADCEAQSGGTKSRLMNASVGGVQVWVTGWQSGQKTLLCVRAQQGSTSAGARFTLDPVPGVTPVAQVGFDTTGCTANVFSNDTAQLAIKRSANNDNPASVCVTRGTSTVRLTLGYNGQLNPNMVAFTKD